MKVKYKNGEIDLDHIQIDGMPFSVFVEQLAVNVARSFQKKEPKNIMTVADAATFLGMKENTLRKKFNNGLIKGHKPDKIIYFFRKDLVEYIKSGELKTIKDIRA